MKTSTRRRLFAGGIAEWILLALLGSMTAAGWGAELPRVQTEFTVESTRFRDGLAERVSEIESEISGAMAEKGAQLFSYLRWQRSADGPAPFSAVLALRLVEEPVPVSSTLEGLKILLRWETFLVRNGERTALPEPLQSLTYGPEPGRECQALPEIYYSWELDFPDRDADQLKLDLQCHLEKHFGHAGFRGDLQTYFLGNIPISQEIIVDENSRRVVLPVHWDELKAADESKLLVIFQSELQNRLGEGKMKLSPSSRILSAPLQNYIQCLIELFRFADTNTLIEERTFWDDRLYPPLDSQNLRGLGVYMEKYEKDIGPRILTEPF